MFHRRIRCARNGSTIKNAIYISRKNLSRLSLPNMKQIDRKTWSHHNRENVFESPLIASQHHNSKIGFHHAPLPSYHVSKYENKHFLINLVVVVVINLEIFYNTPWRRRSRFRPLSGRGWFQSRTSWPGG